MYGNFDAIKRRKILRDEKINSRNTRVDNVKNGIHRSDKKNVFPSLNESQEQAAVLEVQNKLARDQKRNLI